MIETETKKRLNYNHLQFEKQRFSMLELKMERAIRMKHDQNNGIKRAIR